MTDDHILAVGVDVGGTKLLGAAVDATGVIRERTRVTTPVGDPDGLVATIAGIAGELGPDLPLGVGVAGIVSPDDTVRYGPNLDIRDLPLGDRLRAELGTTVTVRNDATVALYGELRAGAGRGSEHVVMLTVGTGVGGAVFTHGTLVEGRNGMGGELGHIPIVDGGRRCPCGNRGCLEAYASGTAIEERARERLRDEDGSSALRDVATDALDGKAVTLAALDGDAFAHEVLREAGYYLGVGMVGLVNVFDPELVLVGGGAAATAAPILLPAALEVLGDRLLGIGHRPLPTVVAAELGDDAGVIGAALLADDAAGAT